ncbi:MAG: LamG domain-containing protein [Saprospiraceae bacterium]|nr:LamG domain-containing protein [Saprospiraceae bacterium]
MAVVKAFLVDYGTFVNGQRFTFNVLWANAIRLEVGGNGLSGTIPVNDGNWHHVAVVFSNPGNNVALYVDGVLDAQGALTVTTNTGTANNVMIGRRIDGVNHFAGDIDEVRIWNYARTQAEIQANMNLELCNTNGLTAYYQFNDGTPNANNTSATTTMDNSGNGNNGTLNNFALNGNSSNWITGAALTTGGGNNTFATISASNCLNYVLPDGNTVTTSGTYTVTIPNTQCGDSIITVNVTINNNTSSSPSLTVCNSYTAPNGDTYFTSQIINYTIPNAAGCDSLIALNLTVLNPASSITETSCAECLAITTRPSRGT